MVSRESWPLLLAFPVALVLSAALTEATRRLAIAANLVDQPDGIRRLHAQPTPYLGGVAVFLAMIATIAIGVTAFGPRPAPVGVSLFALLAAVTAIFALGVVDDLRHLTPPTKLAVQFTVATLLFLEGFGIGDVTTVSRTVIDLPVAVEYVLTTLWLVGVTNAFNLVDGSDGVAGGLAFCGAITLALVCIVERSPFGAVVALAIAGATLGFLFFNFPPASIFLGDAGSMVLGFSLACLGIVTARTTPTTSAAVVPILALGVPILDTGLVVARRFLRRAPLLGGDRSHLHHRLHDLGLSPRKVALSLYALCGTFALLCVLLATAAGARSALILFMAGALGMAFVFALDVPEIRELREVLGRGLDRRVIVRNLRIREAAQQMDQADNLDAFIGALALGSVGDDVDYAELWVDPRSAAFASASDTATASGVLWSWHRNGGGYPEGACEIRLVIHGGDGLPQARLSLVRALHGEPQLADVRLYEQCFQPALERAFRRLFARPLDSPAPVGRVAEPVSA